MGGIKKTQSPRCESLDAKAVLDKSKNKLEIAEENINEIEDRPREVIKNEIQKERKIKNLRPDSLHQDDWRGQKK